MSKKQRTEFDKNKAKLVLENAFKYINYLDNFIPDGDDFDEQSGLDDEKELANVTAERSNISNTSKPKQSKKRKSDNKPILDVKKRLRGSEEIKAKLEEVKGKKMSNIQETLYKKNLKSRLKKNEKKEKRRLLKNKNKVNKVIKRDVADRSDGKENVDKSEKINENGKKVVFNKDAKMVFNKFDFSGIGKNKNKKINKQEKDPKFLLDELKKSKLKINQLEQSGEKEKAKEIKEKQLWASALKKSEGVKVKDDPELLKRTVRKEKEMKNRRKKQWDARVEGVEKKKLERQKKRQDNIAAKKKERKSKKKKQAIKRGRIVI